MRYKFIPGCSVAGEAHRRAPWAADVIDCDGGFMAFESVEDANDFRELHKEKLYGDARHAAHEQEIK